MRPLVFREYKNELAKINCQGKMGCAADELILPSEQKACTQNVHAINLGPKANKSLILPLCFTHFICPTPLLLSLFFFLDNFSWTFVDYFYAPKSCGTTFVYFVIQSPTKL